MRSSRHDSHTLTEYTYGCNDLIFARNRNRKWLLSAVRKEFWDRHFLIRSLVRVCKGRYRLTWITGSALKLTANAATLLWASDIVRWANESDDVPFLFKDIENPI